MAHCRQDMPPPGGYASIMYEKIPLKTGRPWLKVLGLAVSCTFGWIWIHRCKHHRIFVKIEERCGTVALLPLIQAESDRLLLKQLRINREEEERVMKDVEGWEIGKFKKYPIFGSIDEDTFVEPFITEVYAHADKSRKNFLQMMKYMLY